MQFLCCSWVKKCEKVQCKLPPKKTVFKIPWISKAIYFFNSKVQIQRKFSDS